MSGNNAQDQKAKHGETSEKQVPSSAPTGSVLGFGGDRITGEPPLVRNVKDKEGKATKRDFWNEVIKGLDAKKLETTLATAKTDATYDMTGFIRAIEYQGFDREFYIKHALTKMSVSQFCRFAIIGAVRGSKFEKIANTCDGMPADLVNAFQICGFLSGTPKKKTDFTLLRNTASIPHWCVYWMDKAKISKKITNTTCPAALQFPGAASLPMSREIRIAHLDFSLKFSKLLPGGNFNMNIYMTAYGNPIPISDIPVEVAEILKIQAESDNYRLSDEEIQTYSQSLVQMPRR
uniref:NC n=1 Tax=Cercospora beticola negative-stranded virus 4-2 TaxID=2973213 RepID=A0A976XIG6_9MONO|nr:NC [Cercospora beticola negative-stranded virus 4-2]